ncbi:transglutaminase-like domain-containing protein [Roseibacillus ishigakijimensis]|uniref:Transglutaminase domain-containing protein n=1 Tax=Roseibacillus ishigakijimensis TaxID=454146 RepID=A0A934VGN1_9BACT|nr:transglutaminase-like domain-containing protein [Roseibacillus ishigakijimensis]MBK1833043.1 transglutaminase domain-containing protein [Roseibacillus ishigakijimensis]
MKRTLVFLASLCALGSSPLPAATLPPLVEQEILGEQLLSYRYDLLRESLRQDADSLVENLSARALSAALEEDEVRTRLLLLSILNKLPAEAISDRDWTAENRGFLGWLFLSPDRLGMLLNELRPEDDALAVLTNWAELWRREENLTYREQYAPLALALALIYDQPGSVRTSSDHTYQSLDRDERYRYFVKASEGNDLDTSCARMTPRELVRVVDLKISRFEIDWSLKKMRESRKNWGSTYGEVEYLMERAVNGENPYDYYILPEILEKGGICHDQANFASESGKARGIPAVYVHGTGNRGAHAWVEYMPDDESWQSYGSQGIVNGFVYDTQRGKSVSSRLIWLESSEDYRAEKRVPILLMLELARSAREQGKWESAQTLLQEARRMASLVVDIWLEEVELTKAREGQAEDWKNLLADMERNYDEHSNILEDIASIRKEHLLPTLDENEMIKALESEIRSVARKNGSEGDLVSDAVASLAEILVANESGEALRKLYASSFRRYGEDLELFEKLMKSYQSYGRRLPLVAPEIPADLEKYYKRMAETSSKEYFRGEMELKLYQQVGNAYRQAGNEEEADSIAKKIERRRSRLERSAL